MIITIDGRVATGKSTVAKKVANSLGFIYFDTGAMYRAATYALLKEKIDHKDEQQINDFLKKIQIEIKIFRGEKTYLINNEDVTEKIRTPEISSKVSEIAAIPVVREKLVTIQRDLGNNVNAIFEGRDMGTTVFPKAYLKIFLEGSPEIRAQRRYQELIKRFPELEKTLTAKKVLEDINQRDIYDSTREFSPLKRAEDAYTVDTTKLTPDEVAMAILEIHDKKKFG